ncbi:uncharacterized protein LOC125523681 isoform X2 [Triticum urartu]|uniref:uncharacterized protein LOC125523681 isoform X2 n=1 Tax=Triticum urartu TaxID=4572 RepID=UPI002043E191|nr:uncharacterized protein LOC125523681 isoform X2 [Triticum urartu]
MRGEGFGAGRHGRGAGRFDRGRGRDREFDHVWKRKPETVHSSSTRASGSAGSGFDKWDEAAGERHASNVRLSRWDDNTEAGQEHAGVEATGKLMAPSSHGRQGALDSDDADLRASTKNKATAGDRDLHTSSGVRGV